MRWMLPAGSYSRKASMDSRDTSLRQLGAMDSAMVVNHSLGLRGW
jgi:hypothetical protein